MNIKYEDITAIMHVVCYADVLLDSKIKELNGCTPKNKGRTSFEG